MPDNNWQPVKAFPRPSSEWISAIEEQPWAKEAYPEGFNKVQRGQLLEAPAIHTYGGPTEARSRHVFTRKVPASADKMWEILGTFGKMPYLDGEEIKVEGRLRTVVSTGETHELKSIETNAMEYVVSTPGPWAALPGEFAVSNMTCRVSRRPGFDAIAG